MSLLESIGNLLDDSDVTLSECRTCGTTLPEGLEECSHCGSGEVAHYEW